MQTVGRTPLTHRALRKAGSTIRPSRDILIDANQQVTQEWRQARRPEFDVYISQLAEQEISSDDAQAVATRWQAVTDGLFLDIAPETAKLSEQLIEQNAVLRQASSESKRADNRRLVWILQSSFLFRRAHQQFGHVDRTNCVLAIAICANFLHPFACDRRTADHYLDSVMQSLLFQCLNNLLLADHRGG